MHRALRQSTLLLLAAVLLVVVAGCGTADKAANIGSDDSSDSVTIDITIKDQDVQPSGSKVEVKAGKPVHLRIQSDMDGQLHVHSSPEQEIDFSKGMTEKTLTIDQPGLVDVEIHSLDKLVVQLEVR
jgi:uncharacterized lipoprotein YehR (DUF1307 family)